MLQHTFIDYCTNHATAMKLLISQTTDETKADPYAWKNVLALPLVGSGNDVSNQINSGSTAKAFTSLTGNNDMVDFTRGILSDLMED